MKLGVNQRSILEALRRHGNWYPGCGWLWDTKSGTVRILDSLVRKGLVETYNRPRPCWGGKPVGYRLTKEGREF